MNSPLSTCTFLNAHGPDPPSSHPFLSTPFLPSSLPSSPHPSFLSSFPATNLPTFRIISTQVPIPHLLPPRITWESDWLIPSLFKLNHGSPKKPSPKMEKDWPVGNHCLKATRKLLNSLLSLAHSSIEIPQTFPNLDLGSTFYETE